MYRILLPVILTLQGCQGYALQQPAHPNEYMIPCKAPTYPKDGKHSTVEISAIENATELRVCGARHDGLVEAVKRREKQ